MTYFAVFLPATYDLSLYFARFFLAVLSIAIFKHGLHKNTPKGISGGSGPIEKSTTSSALLPQPSHIFPLSLLIIGICLFSFSVTRGFFYFLIVYTRLVVNIIVTIIVTRRFFYVLILKTIRSFQIIIL